MSQSIPAFIGRGDGVETRLMSIPSPAADREDALNSGIPGIGVMSPPFDVTSANPVENPQPVGTKLDLDERGSSTESTNLASSQGLHRGPPRFANVLITNSDWRYCSDRPLSARSARSRSDWCRTQMPGSKVTKRDTNTYSRGLKHGTHSRIRSAAAKLGYQPGPALIDLFVIQFFAPTLLRKLTRHARTLEKLGKALLSTLLL